MFGFALSPLVQALVLASIAGISFGGGWTANDWRRDSQQLSAERADNKAAIGRIDREAEKGKSFEKDKVRIVKQMVPVLKEVERVVTKVEYRDVCLDDDGMRALRAAIRGTEVPAGEPVRAVPGPAGAVDRE